MTVDGRTAARVIIGGNGSCDFVSAMLVDRHSSDVPRFVLRPLSEDDNTKLDQLMDQIGQHEETLRDHDTRIERMENVLQFEKDQAEPVETTDGRGHQPGGRRSDARPRRPDHETEPSLVIGGLCRALVAGGGTVWGARQAAWRRWGSIIR